MNHGHRQFQFFEVEIQLLIRDYLDLFGIILVNNTPQLLRNIQLHKAVLQWIINYCLLIMLFNLLIISRIDLLLEVYINTRLVSIDAVVVAVDGPI